MKPILFACAAVALVLPARADFVLRSAPPPLAKAETVPVGSGVSIQPPRRVPPTPRAEGFGEGIPLSVAARQIVPERTEVAWGDGADPEALVNWTGGRSWNLVLAAAVEPLGLKIIRSPGRVSITR